MNTTVRTDEQHSSDAISWEGAGNDCSEINNVGLQETLCELV